MKKLLNSRLVSFLFVSILIIGMGSFTQSCNSSKEKKETPSEKEEISSWYSSHDWLSGLQLNPSESINQLEFEKLYKANSIWWDKAFEWLKTTDLDTIKPGTYTIDDGNVRAMVIEAPAPELDSVKWEFHKNFSDIQYIVKGKAKMGIGPVSEATVTETYDGTSDIGFGDIEGEFYAAEPGTFFIFTPEDIHRPGIKVEGYDIVKKIVIKVRANAGE